MIILIGFYFYVGLGIGSDVVSEAFATGVIKKRNITTALMALFLVFMFGFLWPLWILRLLYNTFFN